jgi:hypothetical protein
LGNVSVKEDKKRGNVSKILSNNAIEGINKET